MGALDENGCADSRAFVSSNIKAVTGRDRFRERKDESIDGTKSQRARFGIPLHRDRIPYGSPHKVAMYDLVQNATSLPFRILAAPVLMERLENITHSFKGWEGNLQGMRALMRVG
jgi:hypothetical protein